MRFSQIFGTAKPLIRSENVRQVYKWWTNGIIWFITKAKCRSKYCWNLPSLE